MDWERVRGLLEPILQTNVTLIKLSQEQWNRAAAEQGQHAKTCKSAVLDRRIHFYYETQGNQVLTLAIEGGTVSSTERRLVELLMEAQRTQEKGKNSPSSVEDERKARLVKEWLHRQIEAGQSNEELPDQLVTQLSLHATKIPILLYGDYSDTRAVQYHELKKLLDSFFDGEMILIPLLEKEWLILGSETLLAESGGDEGNGEAALQEALAAICQGLHEMLSNEWVGECHLSIHYPIRPAKELLGTVLAMRETIALGKTFDIGSNIHMPWMLQLEKLLNRVPETEKQAFVRQVLKRVDHLDAETIATLDHFFALDCNVSETAKKLYIHRNTLLYRLDKFKQETGLDVRNFSDAVLVKIALLLYKVTKRK